MHRVFSTDGFARQLRSTIATTSFKFMLEDVPLPVWKTSTGKCSLSLPAATSSQARRIKSAFSLDRHPSSSLAVAQAAFTTPKPRIKPSGMVWPLMGKLSTARWVDAPKRASSATSIAPMESFSMRISSSMESGASKFKPGYSANAELGLTGTASRREQDLCLFS